MKSPNFSFKEMHSEMLSLKCLSILFCPQRVECEYIYHYGNPVCYYLLLSDMSCKAHHSQSSCLWISVWCSAWFVLHRWESRHLYVWYLLYVNIHVCMSNFQLTSRVLSLSHISIFMTYVYLKESTSFLIVFHCKICDFFFTIIKLDDGRQHFCCIIIESLSFVFKNSLPCISQHWIGHQCFRLRLIACCNDGTVCCNDDIAFSNDSIACCKDDIACCNEGIAGCKDDIAGWNDGIASCNDGIAGCNDDIASYSDGIAWCKDGK